MQKTKLGISVGLMGLILYCLGLFCNYYVIIAAVVFVLYAEQDLWLRRTAVKVLALSFLFPAIRLVIGFIPDGIGIINDITMMFDKPFSISIVSKILTFITDAIDIGENLIFILLGVMAYSKKTIELPVIDSFINKNVE